MAMGDCGLHQWHLHADRMNISRVLLLDYSKAFDYADHNILVKTLYIYDVPDILVRWIGSFCLTEDSVSMDLFYRDPGYD